MLNEAARFHEENTPARSGVDPGRELRVQSALGLQLSWTWMWARVLPPSSLLGEILDAELPSSYQDFSANTEVTRPDSCLGGGQRDHPELPQQEG